MQYVIRPQCSARCSLMLPLLCDRLNPDLVNPYTFSFLELCKHVSEICCTLLEQPLAVNALTLLVGRQEEHLACKNWVTMFFVVICVERGADCLHMVQVMMPLLPENPIISCITYIQTGFTFLVPAYPVCLVWFVAYTHVQITQRSMEKLMLLSRLNQKVLFSC